MLETPVHRDDTLPSVRIIETVAAAEHVDPVDLDTPLYEAISPSALDRLLEHGGTLDRITFQYVGYQVTVDADGRIELHE